MSAWQTVAIVLLTWAFSAGMTYGIFSERLRSIGHRVERLEKAEDHRDGYVTRTEFEARHKELVETIGESRRLSLMIQNRILQRIETLIEEEPSQ